jgi:hypothetical protein
VRTGPRGASPKLGSAAPRFAERGSLGASRPVYRRHEAEKNVLYQIVSRELETFLAEVRDHCDRPLPAYVEKELRDFMDCGILARGFVTAVCERLRAEAAGREECGGFSGSRPRRSPNGCSRCMRKPFFRTPDCSSNRTGRSRCRSGRHPAAYGRSTRNLRTLPPHP